MIPVLILRTLALLSARILLRSARQLLPLPELRVRSFLLPPPGPVPGGFLLRSISLLHRLLASCDVSFEQVDILPLSNFSNFEHVFDAG